MLKLKLLFNMIYTLPCMYSCQLLRTANKLNNKKPPKNKPIKDKKKHVSYLAHPKKEYSTFHLLPL